jgi:hypothetical protein
LIERSRQPGVSIVERKVGESVHVVLIAARRGGRTPLLPL